MGAACIAFLMQRGQNWPRQTAERLRIKTVPMILDKVPLDIQASWREEIKRFLAAHDHATEDRQAAIQLIFDNSAITLTPAGLDEFLAGDRLEDVEDRHSAHATPAPKKLRKRSVLFLGTLTAVLVIAISGIIHVFKRWEHAQKYALRGLADAEPVPPATTSAVLANLTANRDEVAKWPEVSVTLKADAPANGNPDTEERNRYYLRNHRASPLIFIKAKWTSMPGVQSKISNYTDLTMFTDLGIDPPLPAGQERFLTEGQSIAGVAAILEIWEAVYDDGTKEVSKKYKTATLDALTAQINEEQSRLEQEVAEKRQVETPSP